MKLLEEFQEFRKILCICPKCGEIVRVSDLKLRAKGRVKKTWLDEYEHKSYLLDRRGERFDKQEEKLREKAREKGRRQAQKVFNDAICQEIRQMKYDPYDIRAILNPVDFVVFNGMNQKNSISDVVLLSRLLNNSSINLLRSQVKRAVLKKNYDWSVARIDMKGKIEFE